MNVRSTSSRLLVLSLCAVTACATWKVQAVPPAETLATTRDQARLMFSDRSSQVVNLARVKGDSVIGLSPQYAAGGESRSLSYPLADVRRVELSEISTARTLGVIGGGLVLMGLVVATDMANSFD